MFMQANNDYLKILAFFQNKNIMKMLTVYIPTK
jgi:hypothetical protein